MNHKTEAMSDTEVSLSAEECMKYVMDVWLVHYCDEVAPAESCARFTNDPDKKAMFMREVDRFKQAEQLLHARLGC